MAAIKKAIEKYTKAKAALPSGSELELEMRFQMTKPVFIALYNKCSATGSERRLECTMLMLNDSAGDSRGKDIDKRRLIKQATYVAGVLTEQTTRYKKTLFRGNVPGAMSYTVAVSEEGPADDFKAYNALMRYKSRVSISMGSWRADFTAVYSDTATKIGSEAKAVRQRMFPADVTPDNFLEKMEAAAPTGWELELEYTKTAPPTVADFDVTDTVFTLAGTHGNSAEMQQELAQIAAYVYDRPPADLSQKGIGTQAIALTKAAYYADVFPPIGCYATIKSDGARVLVHVRGGRCYVVYGQSMTVHRLPDRLSREADPTLSRADPSPPSTLPMPIVCADGEEVLVGGTKVIQLFETIAVDGKSVATASLEQRIALRAQAAAVIAQFVPCEVKDYTVLTEDFANQLRDIWEAKRPYPVDGLIIVQPGKGYAATRHFKWKPASQNTTDFLAVVCPDWMLGKPPYIRMQNKTLYLLFCGIRHDLRKALGLGFIDGYRTLTKGMPSTGLYYQTVFTPCENPQAFLFYADNTTGDLDHKVVELLRTDNTILGWHFERIRPDRETGNDFVVAERNYFNVLDPFTLADLGVKSLGYFAQTSPEMRKAPNRFMRFALETVLAVYFAGCPKLIDLGCGRGADLFRFIRLGVQYALFVDSDAQALAELVRRRLESAHIRQERRGGAADDPSEEIVRADLTKVIVKDTDNMTTMVMTADLTEGIALVEKCRRFSFFAKGVGGCVCNMALHYLCGTRAHIEGVLDFVATMLEPGGHFVFVVLDGENVFRLLADLDKGQSWERREHGVPKYIIRKDYSGRTLLPVGQMIAVLLPFADSATIELRPEPLCNVDHVKKLAGDRGLRCVSDTRVSEHAAGFQREAADLAVRLTDDDAFYLSLHRMVCLVRG